MFFCFPVAELVDRSAWHQRQVWPLSLRVKKKWLSSLPFSIRHVQVHLIIKWFSVSCQIIFSITRLLIDSYDINHGQVLQNLSMSKVKDFALCYCHRCQIVLPAQKFLFSLLSGLGMTRVLGRKSAPSNSDLLLGYWNHYCTHCCVFVECGRVVGINIMRQKFDTSNRSCTYIERCNQIV